MRLFGSLIHFFARASEWAGDRFHHLSNLLNGILPVALSQDELTTLIRNFYRKAYADWHDLPNPEDLFLEPWETEVLDRHHVRSGTLLVLGSGVGREPILIAQRGVATVGVDTNANAVRQASRTAATLGVRAHFLQASFLDLPFTGSSFNYVLLPSTMYSAVAGVPGRRAWLQDLRRLLKPDGFVMLSFSKQHDMHSPRARFLTSLNGVLRRLPSSNPSYQPGDDCVGGHFLHGFQSETEIREELLQAGAVIKELQWERGFAVVALGSDDSIVQAATSQIP
jgi:ubiquinone/menaquinone biosynthesis C-methylase UbiE